MNARRALQSLNHCPLIDLIFFDAGGGHRASAAALKSVIEQQGWPWRVRMINLREVLDSIDLMRRLSGIRAEDLYNRMLKHGMTLGSGPALRVTQALIRSLHGRQVLTLARHWHAPNPDLVVSLVPNFNRAIFQAVRAVETASSRQSIPMVTIMTDLADYPPHFWIERQDQYLICPTETAVTQALATGLPPYRIFRTSGLIVNPEFYRPRDLSREQARQRLGLDPNLPVALVMFGGFGSQRIVTIARRIAASGLKLQLVLMCGKNAELRRRLGAMRFEVPCHIEGFTTQVAHFMHLADFFIGKPGPGSVSEALVTGLPIIVERNAFTMVQERYNTGWIAQNQVGLVIPSFRDIAGAAASILAPGRLSRLRANVALMNNRAVFEIPALLDFILARSSGREHDAASA